MDSWCCVMERVENRMVVDSEWEHTNPVEIEEIVSATGYHKVGTDVFVADHEAYDYALDQCLNGSEEDIKEFKSMLVEWYYSGGAWRRENNE